MPVLFSPLMHLSIVSGKGRDENIVGNILSYNFLCAPTHARQVPAVILVWLLDYFCNFTFAPPMTEFALYRTAFPNRFTRLQSLYSERQEGGLDFLSFHDPHQLASSQEVCSG